MTAVRRFPNDAAAVRAARGFALESLAAYSPDLLEVVELLVSELATNSVRHTDSGFELRVAGDRHRIRISVTDCGPGSPAVQRQDPKALSGRGLALVEMLSSSWGVSPSQSGADGKTVWFELAVAADQLRAASSVKADGRASVKAGGRASGAASGTGAVRRATSRGSRGPGLLGRRGRTSALVGVAQPA